MNRQDGKTFMANVTNSISLPYTYMLGIMVTSLPIERKKRKSDDYLS